MREVWKDIPDYEGYYQVSSLGNILRVGNSKRDGVRYFKRKNTKTPYGYYTIQLSKKGKERNFFVHRLVLRSFVGPSELQVNHKDGNKLNNRLNNLEYVTNLENTIHKVKNRLHAYGENHSKSKLSANQVIAIRELLKLNLFSNTEIAKIFKITQSTVSLIKNKKIWKIV